MLVETTSLVPAGDVLMHSRSLESGGYDGAAGRTLVRVEPVLLDRYAVTNRDYQHFVEAGGYEQAELWEASLGPSMDEFVDKTDQPGPRYWCEGRHSPYLAEHPVVGVNWYEAAAYARWVGKRLPSDAQWVKAGVWPVATCGVPQQRRYPWGDTFDHFCANVCGSPGTVPVHDYSLGVSVGGVHQLCGNVWEWTSSAWNVWEPTKATETDVAMRSCAAVRSTPISTTRPPASFKAATIRWLAGTISASAALCLAAMYPNRAQRSSTRRRKVRLPHDRHLSRTRIDARRPLCHRPAVLHLRRGEQSGRRAVPALPCAAFSFGIGQKVRPPLLGVIGPSGVGKTVYLGMLLDLLSRQSDDWQLLARARFPCHSSKR